MRATPLGLGLMVALGSAGVSRAEAPCGPPVFPGRIHALSHGPRIITPIDLDERGAIDVVVAHRQGVIPVLSGADGALLPQPAIFTGHDVSAVTVADFDGDGHEDLAVSDWIGTVTMLRGDGTGALVPAGAYATGLWSSGVTSGDFDGDGTIDLAVPVWHDVDPALNLLFGRGDGSFHEPEFRPTDGIVRDLTCVDIDGDGDLDLVGGHQDPATDADALATLINDGSGRFTLGALLPQPERLRDPRVVDINGDGIADVVARRFSLLVFTGNGDGTFAAGVEITSASKFALADVDRDGDVDVAALAHGDEVVMHLNDGAGNFVPGSPFYASEDTDAIGFADVTGDGLPDFVYGIGRYERNGIVAIAGAGDGTFAAADRIQAADGIEGVAAVTDLDGDGFPDLVLHARYDRTLSVLLNRGDGTFDEPVDYETPSDAGALRIADFDQDGHPDLAIVREHEESAVRVYFGTGGGSFGPTSDYDMPGVPRSLAVGQTDADDHPDLVVVSWEADHVSVRRGLGDGTFGPPAVFPTADRPGSVAVGDLTGDGVDDVVTGSWSGTVSILRAVGDGTFANAVSYPCPYPFEPRSLVVADVDDDGHCDLVAANNDNVVVFLNDGDGGLENASTFTAGSHTGGVAVGDLDGDAIADLAAANAVSGDISILRGAGDGTFGAPVNVVAYRPSVRMADIDGDGDLDLVSSREILLNDACPAGDVTRDGVVDFEDVMRLLAAWGPCPDPRESCPADLNGDGVVGYADLLHVLANWG